MLKIRTFFIALAFAPLISLTWQLTNQAQTNSPSRGTAGSASGGGSTGSGGTVFTSPSRGTAGSASGGGNTGSNNNPVSSPSRGTAGSASGGGNTGSNNTEPESPNISVTREPNGSLRITLPPVVVQQLNTAAAGILASDSRSIFSPANAASLTASLTSNGLPPQLAQALTGAVSNILIQSRPSTTPSFPSVQLPQERLVASIKASKAGLTIAETNEAVTVNVDKLNESINIYNKIVLETDPATLQKLSRNSNFVAIGKALNTLRATIK